MKSIIYYTDNELDEPLNSIVQMHIHRSNLPIASASLKPIRFGENVVVEGERGYPTMVNQIIAALETAVGNHVFFCEHDVLYHPSHFTFTPPKDNIFYYNENVWRWLYGSNQAMRHDRMIPLSSMCANREFALEHYRLRAARIKEKGWTQDSKDPKWVRVMGYEPGTKKKKRGGITDDDFETWSSDFPLIDIRHDKTFSPPKVSLRDFTHKPKNWRELPIEKIVGWDLKELFKL